MTVPIDKSQARRAFARAAPAYDRVAVLQREVATRLLQRLDLVRLEPRRILDLGAGTGEAATALLKRYPRAELVALDFALPMLQRARRRGRWRRRPRCLCADLEQLPLAGGCADLIFSNAALQWATDPAATFRDWRRVLRPGGLTLFSTFGPDTLKELRAAWAEVDDAPHVHPLADLHDLGDALVRAGFAEPVLDVDRITLTYPDLRALMTDLKALGAHNVARDRPRGLTGRARLSALERAYAGHRRDDGRLPASYEVIYGIAWVPAPTPVRVPLDGLHAR